MKKTILLTFSLLAILAASIGCGDDAADGSGGAGSGTTSGPGGPAGPGSGPTSGAGSTSGTNAGGGPGAGGAGGGSDCFEDPQTHLEIINACTDAEMVDKDPVLPLLEPDGSLPPLP